MRIMESKWSRIIVLTLLWLFFTTTLHKLIISGHWVVVIIYTIFITVVVPVSVTYIDRKRPFWKVLDPRRQSWAFMFGDPLFLASALGVVSYAYSRESAPAFAYTEAWFLAMYTLGWAASIGLMMADRVRYIQNDALEAYNRPDKMIHDRVVVPVLFSCTFATLPPLMLDWSILVTTTVLLLALWGGLLLVDDKLRFVDPKWQYDL